jgi:hypothetical protein
MPQQHGGGHADEAAADDENRDLEISHADLNHEEREAVRTRCKVAKKLFLEIENHHEEIFVALSRQPSLRVLRG